MRFHNCPHCNKKIVFKIEKEDIDFSQFPAPVYIHHNDKSCDKISTFYVDSLLRVSYREREKKDGAIKTLETL